MIEKKKISNKKKAHTKPVKRTAKVVLKKTAAAAKRSKPAVAKAVAQAPKENTVPVYDLKGKPQEKFSMDALFTEGRVNTDVIYQAVLMYRAGEREGTAATKTRGEVRGGGKKPWKQKGTGQARHGSRRSPIWRGGGVTFGPHPRDYSYSIPREIRKQAVTEGIKDKVFNGKFMMVDHLETIEPKTKNVVSFMDALKLAKPLLVVEKKTENLLLASRNIRQVAVKTAEEVNVLDVVSHHECVMTKGAYSGLLKRLKS